MVNLSAAIHYHARHRPNHDAILYDGKSTSYAELSQRVMALAAGLYALGTKPGQVVAALMKNSPAFLEVALAVSHVGAVFLPLNFRLAGTEVRYILEHAGAQLLYVDQELVAQSGDFRPAILIDAAARHGHANVVADSTPVVTQGLRAPEDLYRLMYTSGTTDRPKGVMHSYANFYWKCMDHILALGLSAQERLLIVGPMYHVGAYDLPGLAVLWLGGTLCILRDFDPEHVLDSIERERLTGAWMAPVMLNSLLPRAQARRYDVSSFRWCIGGGERTPEARIRDFGAAFPAARYIDAYGLTETCSGDTLMPAGRELDKIGSCGVPTCHVQLQVRDEEGRLLSSGEQGEICLRGPKVTRGYWRDPQKTAASFHGDWFRTGDVGYVDEEGFLYLTDRKKDMIISGGENIASSEVERVIYLLPQVGEVAVIGVPDARWGERPIAVVVPRPGVSLDFDTLTQHCRRHLAGFKVPRELHLRDALPRNPSGKILKRLLREQFAGPQ